MRTATTARLLRHLALPLALALAVAPEAYAQGSGQPALAELLPALILRDIVLPRPGTSELSHEAHFSPIDANDLQNPAVGIVQSFNKLLMMQLSTFPLASSAGGFTYSFDETLGTFRRASGSFGPSFAERAMTIGRRRFGAGVNYKHTAFHRFEGQPLDDGSIRFYLRHDECCSPGAGAGRGSGGGGGGGGGGGAGPTSVPDGSRLSPAFEGDLIEAALSLDATTDTVAFFANYGITDRWDVGLVVPIVHVELDASVRATILRLATEDEPLLHTFEEGNAQAVQRTFGQRGSATGLGDVSIRTKYHALRFAGGGVAGAVDIRLPTGDNDNLLGAGGQVRWLVVASGGTGRFAPHANFGYTSVIGDVPTPTLLAALDADRSLPDEVNYAAGLEVVAHPRLTLVGDIVGRTLRNAGRLRIAGAAFEFRAPSAVQTARFDEFEPRRGNLELVLGTVGLKWNPVGDVLFSGSILFPLTDSGLLSRLTTVVGLDYAF